VASDASASGWGGSLLGTEITHVSDYWSPEELRLDITTREAIALERVLLTFPDIVRDAWVDALVDNQAVIAAWHHHGGRSPSLNTVLKRLFFTTVKFNISLHLLYIPTDKNPADGPSRRLSNMDSKLHPHLWEVVQNHFGGYNGHSIDLMALDSNTMTDLEGRRLPHFTPQPSPESSGVNVFAQDLSVGVPLLERPYVFPPVSLVGVVLRLLEGHKRSCTFVTLDVYPKKYWWPLIMRYSNKSLKLAEKDDPNALLIPSKKGWVPHQGIPGDLWAFAVTF